MRGDEVGRKRRADDLHLVPEALGPERPDRAVDHAGSEDRLLGRAPLALEEAAGDLAGRVHPLLDVDGEREEVRALARLGAALRRSEDHRVPARTTTAPSACLASLPVSKRISSRPTAAVTDVISGAIVLMCSSFSLRETEAEV